MWPVCFFSVLIFAVVVLALNAQLLGDPDCYWHIVTGKWMLTEHEFPRRDIFSYTASGRPWVDMEWIAQVILSATYDLCGWRGLVLLCGILISLTFVLMYELLVSELRPSVALGAVVVRGALGKRASWRARRARQILSVRRAKIIGAGLNFAPTSSIDQTKAPQFVEASTELHHWRSARHPSASMQPYMN
jgi:hypothetical protein